jgi:hypothetical protein
MRDRIVPSVFLSSGRSLLFPFPELGLIGPEIRH